MKLPKLVFQCEQKHEWGVVIAPWFFDLGGVLCPTCKKVATAAKWGGFEEVEDHGTLPTSVLVLNQKKIFEKVYPVEGGYEKIVATVRYDECGNGHNTLSVTADIWRCTKNGHPIGRDSVSCGCNHDAVLLHFPELRDAVEFHLCSTDGPLHYIANTVYHAREKNYDAARASAIWPDSPDENFWDPYLDCVLKARLPRLMQKFRGVVESLGFTY